MTRSVRPGPVLRAVFGYHVVQVDSRVTHRTRRPFAEVREVLAERLGSRRAAEARDAFMARARAEVRLVLREAGRRDASLLDERAVAAEEILAEIEGKPIRESDFRWFLRDALLPGQRTSAWSRPGARRGMVGSFLDLRVLAAKARRERLDRTESFVRRLAAIEESLLQEFAEARDGVAPPGQCTAVGPDRRHERRAYLDRLRAVVGLQLFSSEPRP